MRDLMELQKKIVPEMIEILEKRYNILRNVFYHQPIGRRTLANTLGVGERIIRSEVNILRDQNLLEIKSMGMSVTEEGLSIIDELKDFIYQLKGLSSLEKHIETKLGIHKVYVIPGNYDEDQLILKDLGTKASNVIKSLINEDSIMGITGGTTMAQVAENMNSSKTYKDLLVLPARGGLGKDVETQANNIAANLAQKLGGTYKLLHIPDNIGKEALESLLHVPEIRELLDMIKRMDLLIFGLGRADDMAKRRQLSETLIKELMEKGAVAEAFGHYFNTKGEIIYQSDTVGLTLENFRNMEKIVGVAAGPRKAEAIIAICALNNNISLVTDEGAAKKILALTK